MYNSPAKHKSHIQLYSRKGLRLNPFNKDTIETEGSVHISEILDWSCPKIYTLLLEETQRPHLASVASDVKAVFSLKPLPLHVAETRVADLR